MRNRFKDADTIWNGGASNPRGVARALVDAIDEGGAECPAVKMILDHLCYLCGMPQPSFHMSEWDAIYNTVVSNAEEPLK